MYVPSLLSDAMPDISLPYIYAQLVISGNPKGDVYWVLSIYLAIMVTLVSLNDWTYLLEYMSNVLIAKYLVIPATEDKGAAPRVVMDLVASISPGDTVTFQGEFLIGKPNKVM